MMSIETFELERYQSVWENEVKFNLTESGIHPFTLKELLTDDQIEDLLNIRLGYGQTNGSKSLRDVISQLYHGLDRNNVLVTNGSAGANFVAIWSILEPGDELVLMLPNYMQIWGVARSFGIQVKPFYLREENGWNLDFDEFDNLISDQTRMIAVCNPNNPTGKVLNKNEMEGLVSRANDHNILIYSDEIYRGAELNGQECPSFLDLHTNTVVASGLSKALSHPGLRLGWLAGPRELIEKAWHHHDYTSISTSIISQEVACIILEEITRQKILNRNRSLLNKNLLVIKKWVDKHSGYLRFLPPEAGGFAFIKLAIKVNPFEFAERLRKEKGVLIIPGDFFGMNNYIRIGIGSETEFLSNGLDLIDELLVELV